MSISYPIKHWATSLTMSPAFLVVYGLLFDSRYVLDDLEVYVFFVIVGALFSLPALVLYVLMYRTLLKAETKPSLMRGLLYFAAITMALIAFLVIGGSLEVEVSVAYIAGIFISGWFYQLKPAATEGKGGTL